MFRELLNDKIGNILLLLAKEVSDLYLTKALKLLYIIDETAVKETGVPVTWLDHKIWKFGPVAEEIYDEIKYKKFESFNGNQFNLNQYIAFENTQNPINEERDSILIKTKGDNIKEEIFSDYEIDLLKRVLKEYGKYSRRELKDMLHKEDSLWNQCVKKEKIQFSIGLNGYRSNYSIDFTSLLKDDYYKQQAYKSALASLTFQFSLHSDPVSV
jgi:uncharacterized phage-associated protein